MRTGPRYCLIVDHGAFRAPVTWLDLPTSIVPISILRSGQRIFYPTGVKNAKCIWFIRTLFRVQAQLFSEKMCFKRLEVRMSGWFFVATGKPGLQWLLREDALLMLDSPLTTFASMI